jgi:hypothetical protein
METKSKVVKFQLNPGDIMTAAALGTFVVKVI